MQFAQSLDFQVVLVTYLKQVFAFGLYKLGSQVVTFSTLQIAILPRTAVLHKSRSFRNIIAMHVASLIGCQHSHIVSQYKHDHLIVSI